MSIQQNIIKPFLCLCLILTLAFHLPANHSNNVSEIEKFYITENHLYSLHILHDNMFSLAKTNLKDYKTSTCRLDFRVASISLMEDFNKSKKNIEYNLTSILPYSWLIVQNKIFKLEYPFCGPKRTISFQLFTSDMTEYKKNNSIFLNKLYQNANQNLLSRHRFYATSLRQLKNDVWSNIFAINSKIYSISKARFAKGQNRWGTHQNDDSYTKWRIFENVRTHFNSLGSIKISDDFIPQTVMAIPGGFEICVDNGTQFIHSKDIFCYIWGKSKKDNHLQLAALKFDNQTNKYIVTVSNVKQKPKIILRNYDSKYVMLIYNQYTGKNQDERVANIIRYLRKRNLITVVVNKKLEGKKSLTTTESPRKQPLPPLTPEGVSIELEDIPGKVAFTTEEFYTLFKKPDFDKITNLYERACAYDWHNMFKEAEKTLEKTQKHSVKARFMLGEYYKYGRPGIKPNKQEANKIFQSIINELNRTPPESLTGEDCCLIGRAYLAQGIDKWWEDRPLIEKAKKPFALAVKKGYLSAYFYQEYPWRNSSKFDRNNFLKAVASGNLEAKTFIAGLAIGGLQAYSKYYNSSKNLQTIKDAVKAHSLVGQYAVGSIYAQRRATKPVAYNRDKAIFWLTRAKERGSKDAENALKYLPPPKKRKITFSVKGASYNLKNVFFGVGAECAQLGSKYYIYKLALVGTNIRAKKIKAYYGKRNLIIMACPRTR
jgi:TPR repeat protein